MEPRRGPLEEAMTHSLPESKRRSADAKRRGAEDAMGTVLRAVALAALALGIGVGASLLVDTRQPGHPGVPAAAR